MAKEKRPKENNSPEVVMEYNNEPSVVMDSEKPKKKKIVKTPSKKKKTSTKKSAPRLKKKVKKEPVKKKPRDVKEKSKSRKKKEREEVLKKKIEVPIDNMIQALLDSERTFVDNITGKAKKGFFSSFYPFPKNIRFASTEKDEAVVLMVRHHWTGLLPRAILALFAFFFPFLLSSTTDVWFDSMFSVIIFNSGMFLFFAMLTVSILIDGFLKWFFEMNVITTTRIVDLDFVSIMTHRMSETTFDLVQDISHSPAGPLASFFDYGDLYIQTAGAKNEFHFDNIPRPRDIQDTIWDLRYLRKKKLAEMGK